MNLHCLIFGLKSLHKFLCSENTMYEFWLKFIKFYFHVHYLDSCMLIRCFWDLKRGKVIQIPTPLIHLNIPTQNLTYQHSDPTWTLTFRPRPTFNIPTHSNPLTFRPRPTFNIPTHTHTPKLRPTTKPQHPDPTLTFRPQHIPTPFAILNPGINFQHTLI